MAGTKIPESVLVVVHAPGLQVLLLERADHPGFWQSVTGSRDTVDEPLVETCRREVMEETGIDVACGTLEDWGVSNRYEIYPHWRHRYPEGTTHNVEHVFGLALPAIVPVRLSPREHLRFGWLPWDEAAGRCFSMSNVEAIRMLPARAGRGAA
ncbi:MAG TPA: dihydroneopterin triphosphate diphosphatase [Burkholderiaceae bacterium]|nr:dihydroneopterin triphosphate diphosphatase [Burkholderiaceae bacterium]